jgi:hypothetical protein
MKIKMGLIQKRGLAQPTTGGTRQECGIASSSPGEQLGIALREQAYDEETSARLGYRTRKEFDAQARRVSQAVLGQEFQNLPQTPSRSLNES